MHSVSDDEESTCSSDDSEMSVEINLSRYSQKWPLTEETLVTVHKTPDQCISSQITSTTPSSGDTLLSCETLLSSDSSERNEYYQSPETGASFILNQPVNDRTPTPSLFNRKQYVTEIIENETVLCVLVSTYGLDEMNFIQEIPCLLGPSSTVPTLIMYGKKVSSTSKRRFVRRQEQKWLHDVRNVSSSLRLVHIQPRHRRASFMGYADQGKGILGVHHPKYILLFTTSGLHVLISTANMTPQVHAAEGTFTHFFPVFHLRPPLQAEEKRSHVQNDYISRKVNDFGEVLDDFLNKQSEQLGSHTSASTSPVPSSSSSSSGEGEGEGEGTHPVPPMLLASPRDWRRFYPSTEVLERERGREHLSLADTFDFSGARVHLVSVVPGCFPLPTTPRMSQDADTLQREEGEEENRRGGAVVGDGEGVCQGRAERYKKQQRRRCKQCLLERDRLRSHTLDTDATDSVGECVRIQYGAARLKQLLTRQQPCLRSALGPKDMLIMQPTSIGGGVDNKYMSELLSAYMPEPHWDYSSALGFSQAEGRRMDALRILWPEAPFMRESEMEREGKEEREGEEGREVEGTPELQHAGREGGGGGREVDPDLTDSDDDTPAGGGAAEDSDKQLVFLLPKTLALMEPDLQSQLFVYQAYSWKPSTSLRAPPRTHTLSRVLSSSSPPPAASTPHFLEQRRLIESTQRLDFSILNDGGAGAIAEGRVGRGRGRGSKTRSLVLDHTAPPLERAVISQDESLPVSQPKTAAGAGAGGSRDTLFAAAVTDTPLAFDTSSSSSLPPPPPPPPPPPHIKSYARLLSRPPVPFPSRSRPTPDGMGADSGFGAQTVIGERNERECTCYDLAWFLLTSACLSKGGQGQAVPPRTCKDCHAQKEAYIEYKNFELGVLFHSGTDPAPSSPSVARSSSSSSSSSSRRGVEGDRDLSSSSSSSLASYVQYRAYNRSCSVHSHPVLGPSPGERPPVGTHQRGGCGSDLSPERAEGREQRASTRGEGGRGREEGVGGGGGGEDTVIVLPVPYDMLGADPFCSDKGFLREPYFHDKSELKKYDGQLQLCKFSDKQGEKENRRTPARRQTKEVEASVHRRQQAPPPPPSSVAVVTASVGPSEVDSTSDLFTSSYGVTGPVMPSTSAQPTPAPGHPQLQPPGGRAVVSVPARAMAAAAAVSLNPPPPAEWPARPSSSAHCSCSCSCSPTAVTVTTGASPGGLLNTVKVDDASGSKVASTLTSTSTSTSTKLNNNRNQYSAYDFLCDDDL